jgi:hypothetical protein
MAEIQDFFDDKEHTDECLSGNNTGRVISRIKCPECDEPGFHTTESCENCGHELC